MKVLAYTSPARGHFQPLMGVLAELRDRGVETHLRTLSSCVDAAAAAGVDAAPIDPRIEDVRLDDHAARTQPGAVKRCLATWAQRAPLEVADLRAAIADIGPDVLLVDTTTFGARAEAEAGDLPWVESRPFLFDEPAPGVPPFGLGLSPRDDLVGRLRDGLLRTVVSRMVATAKLPTINAGREAAGLPPLRAAHEGSFRAPLTLSFTSPPFDAVRPHRDDVLHVGPCSWDPREGVELDVALDDRKPLVLVACSSEYQDDAAIAEAALAGLTDDHQVVVTSAGVDPASLTPRGDAVVRRFLPHGPLLDRASVVVCHGGMGITQRALARGVPVVVVPWARDQLDVAVRVEQSASGVRVPRKRLTPARLSEAVHRARTMADGAAAVAAGYAAAGGAPAAAEAITRLGERRATTGAR